MEIKLDWEPRAEQFEILDGFKQSLEASVPFYLIDAPTGTGKSYAAMMMAKKWKEHTHGGKTDILTNSKMLQSQYLKDFPYLGEMKGKSNYFCERFGTDCEQGADLAKKEKEDCINCPHQMAFERFITSRASMMNFHLFSSYAMFVPFILEKRGADMLVIDEAHSFEEVFTDFISITLSKRVLSSFGLDGNPTVVQKMQEVECLEDLEDFYNNYFKSRVTKHVKELSDRVNSTDNRKKQSNLLKSIKSAQRFLSRFGNFLNDENRFEWIFQKQDTDPNDNEGIIPKIKLEPTWARDYLWNMIWKKYKKVVFMSATILDPEIFTFINGIDKESMYCTIDSPFPVDNRLVQYAPVGKMSYKHKDKTIHDMIPRIKRILEKNPDSKGIIHTGNYSNAYKLREQINDRRLIFHGSGEAGSALKRHENTNEPTVLVSPAMTHGVDLKDELSRLQVIMKIPFPSLADKRIKKRLHESQRWYTWRTWIEVVQSCGRSVRTKEDWATTYILDKSFDQLLKYEDMMPSYFKDALIKP